MYRGAMSRPALMNTLRRHCLMGATHSVSWQNVKRTSDASIFQTKM